jgi:hypothetical protein
VAALRCARDTLIESAAMRNRILFSAIVAMAWFISPAAAQLIDLGKYPDLNGQWRRVVLPGIGGQGGHDQTKPVGFAQQAPLTPEYVTILEKSLADLSNGGLELTPTSRCLPAGMPHMMMAFGPQEYVITPGTTYILIDWDDHGRRIFTDGRDWPSGIEPSWAGYSIGRWIDADGDGRHNVLEVETRGPFKGPRVYDSSGLPLHLDNQSIFKERIYLDKADPNILHDEMTTIDHALTRPWTVDKRYRRTANAPAAWSEYYCGENNAQIVIGGEHYFLVNGMLAPVRKGQDPPDLRYFAQPAR